MSVGKLTEQCLTSETNVIVGGGVLEITELLSSNAAFGVNIATDWK